MNRPQFTILRLSTMVKYSIASTLLATATSFLASAHDIPTLQLSLPYQPLAKPPSFDRLDGGNLAVRAELRMDAANYVGPSYNHKVRVYNGMPVGPTIRGECRVLKVASRVSC